MVFALTLDRGEVDSCLQTDEFDSVRWMDLDECISAVNNNTIRHCIFPEELEMVRKAAVAL